MEAFTTLNRSTPSPEERIHCLSFFKQCRKWRPCFIVRAAQSLIHLLLRSFSATAKHYVQLPISDSCCCIYLVSLTLSLHTDLLNSVTIQLLMWLYYTDCLIIELEQIVTDQICILFHSSLHTVCHRCTLFDAIHEKSSQVMVAQIFWII